MSPQWENLCVTGTLFLFRCSFVTVVGTTCDTWRTYVCDGAGAGNRGGSGGSNLGRPLGMAGGKSSWVDVSICTDSEFEEVGGCNEGRSKEVGGCIDGRFKEVGSCADGRSKEVGVWTEDKFKEMGGCTDSGSKEVGSYTNSRSEKMGDCTNREDKKVGGYNDVDTDDVMGWQLIYLHLPWDVDRPRISGSQATVD